MKRSSRIDANEDTTIITIMVEYGACMSFGRDIVSIGGGHSRSWDEPAILKNCGI
jgi:hypothetical protein